MAAWMSATALVFVTSAAIANDTAAPAMNASTTETPVHAATQEVAAQTHSVADSVTPATAAAAKVAAHPRTAVKTANKTLASKPANAKPVTASAAQQAHAVSTVKPAQTTATQKPHQSAALATAAKTNAHASQRSAYATISTDAAKPTAPARAKQVAVKAVPQAAVVKPTVAAGQATKTAGQVAKVTPQAAPTHPQAGNPAAGTPNAKAVSMTPSITPVQTARPAPGPSAAKATPMVEVTAVEERVTYQYNALGRRDPFAPLVGGAFVGAEEQNAPPDVGGLKVVGIVWGAEDKFALVEDPRGNSRVLRTGDKVMNGVVDGLRRDAVIVKLTTEGGTELLQIPLTRKGDDSNANR